MLCGTWGLSPQTKGRFHAPELGVWSLNHQATREVSRGLYILVFMC